MLQLIRTMGVEKRWVFGSIMALVVVAFIGMGGVGIESDTNIYAAKVNGEIILAKEFSDRYRNQYRYLQNLMGDQFNDSLTDGIKQSVLKSMIQRRLWLGLSNDLGLMVSDDELKQSIMSDPSFQLHNRFDGGSYRRALNRAGLSPEVYEDDLRAQMLVQRAQELILTSVTLLPGDVNGMIPPADTEDTAQWLVAEKEKMLQTKQRQVVAEYANYLEAQATIQTFPEALGPIRG